MLTAFLRRMSFTLTSRHSRDVELAERVGMITKTWPFEDRIRKHIITGVTCAQVSYSHIDIDARVAVAVYTTILSSLDDQALFDALGAQSFSRMLCDGSVHRDEGMLGQLAKVLVDIHRHFPPFCASVIVSATLRWFGGEMTTSPYQPAFLNPNSKGVVDYQRWMSGNAESYACFIWQKAWYSDEALWINVLP